jgi:PAS domain-containing protein
MFDPKALRSFLDLLSDAVLVLDRGGRVYFANATASRLLKAEAGIALAGLTPLLGEALVAAVSPVLAKGVARVGRPNPLCLTP